MISYGRQYINLITIQHVLILIVVEDDLVRAALNATIDNEDKVLILIVVDDGLVHRILLKDSLANAKVLILIVVDNGLVQTHASGATMCFFAS